MNEAIENAIMNIPDDPEANVVWVCYNKHMIKQNKKMIESLRGSDFLSKIIVVSGEEIDSTLRKELGNAKIYYSPDFFSHRGNGAN